MGKGEVAHNTLIRIDAPEKQRCDLVFLEIQTEWCLGSPETGETICSN
jgi:hypothetical protein